MSLDDYDASPVREPYSNDSEDDEHESQEIQFRGEDAVIIFDASRGVGKTKIVSTEFVQLADCR